MAVLHHRVCHIIPNMKIVQLSQTKLAEAVAKAVTVLEAGGLVLYPTETVYGAGVDATNQGAVDKLLQYKSRREGKPLSIVVSSQAMAEQFVEINDQARQLYQQFLPGPMTIVSQAKANQQLARGVTSEFQTLGIRISSHPFVAQLVSKLNKPITATSANASGKRQPYSVTQVLDHLSEKQKSLVDLIIDAGTLPSNPPSTVIDTTLSTPVIFRQGSLLQTQSNTISLISHSEQETKAIAGKLLLKHWNQLNRRPIVFGLNGPLGAGKTIFAKGVAEFLGIQATLVSPTYTYIEEYAFAKGQTLGKLHHIDVWKVDSNEMFKRLEIDRLLQSNTILVIEWFSQIADWMKPSLHLSKTDLIEVSIDDQIDQRKLAILEHDV